MKKTPGGIIILHNCTKSHDHMLYCSWDMACDHCNCYFLFWAIFCPFTSLTPQNIKILKKFKKILEISWFYTCAQKIMIRWCTVPEIWCAMDRQTDRKSDIERWVAHLKMGWETKQIKTKKIKGANQREQNKEVPPIHSSKKLIKNQNNKKW